jgi:signal transduction protein with GAF and PtsI domain
VSGEKHPDLDLPIILETPPAPEQPGGDLGGLLGDETIGCAAAKAAALESLIALVVRDYRFDDLMREILIVAIKAVRSEAGSIFEFDHRNNCLFFRATVGTASDKLGTFTVPAGKGIVGHVAESRQPLAVENAGDNEIHFRAIQDAVGFETHNLVAVPIIIRGRIFGVLELLNRVGTEGYSAMDVELLLSICDASAKVIESRLMLANALARGARREAA